MPTNLDSFVAVPISNEIYAEFSRRYPGGVSTVLENVAQDFLDRTAEKFPAAPTRQPGIFWPEHLCEYRKLQELREQILELLAQADKLASNIRSQSTKVCNDLAASQTCDKPV